MTFEPFPSAHGNLIIDVGANSGEFSLAMARRNPQAKVLAIDPLPHLCEQIRQQASKQQLSNLWVEKAAIDLEERIATFNVANHHDQGISSLLKLDDGKIRLDDYWKDREDLYFDQQLAVDVKRLSQVLDQQPPRRILFIKIDAQGVDLNVLESLDHYLAITDAGMLEVTATQRQTLYVGESHTLRSALNKLADLGFEPYAIKPNDHAANEYNVFFCRTNIDPLELESRLKLNGVHLYDGKHFWHNPSDHWLEAPNRSATQVPDETVPIANDDPIGTPGNSVVDAEILKRLAGRKKVHWAGWRPPLPWFHHSTRLFDPAFDYRLPASEHQSYDLVYLTECDLGGFKAWPLIVDEALRLLKPDGLLAFRMSNSPLLSIFELMNLINARSHVVLHHESVDANGMVNVVVRNVNAAQRPQGIEGLSFGIITNGQRNAEVAALVQSVYALRNPRGIPVELLVCGPRSTIDFLNEHYLSVKHVAEPDRFQELGWITRKKNLLVESASQPVAVIAHDRYQFPVEFLEQLDQFGGDFDVVVCRQTMQDGRRFPDWVALGTDWSWGHPTMLNYGDWSRRLYVNGGLMIAKTSILQKTPWNEMLFWNQAEDVELTRRLHSAGVVPRLARRVEAVTQTMRPGLMGGFVSTPLTYDRHLNPGPLHTGAEFPLVTARSVTAARMGHKFEEHRIASGVVFGGEWVESRKSCTLEPRSWGEITVNTHSNTTFRRTLEIGLTRQIADLKILVNDQQPAQIRLGRKSIYIQLTPGMAVSSRVCRVHVWSPDQPVSVRHVVLAPRNLSSMVLGLVNIRIKARHLGRKIQNKMRSAT